MLPELHRKILNEYVKEIRVVKTGNSSFNRITGVVTILEGMEEGELIHELGHALETKFDLKNNIEYEQLLQNLVKNKNNSDIIPSLTVNKRQNSLKTCVYRLCGCLLVCIDMYYIFVFVLFIFFVFEIILRIEAFDINSKSVLNPNAL